MTKTPSITIEPIAPEEYGGVIQDIFRRGLGRTYADDIRSIEEDGVLLVACVDGWPVGFACGYVGPEPEDYIAYFDEETGARSLLEKVVVHPDWRGRGIGTALVRELLERLEQPTLSSSWRREDARDSTELFEKLGFEVLAEYDELWYEESLGADDPEFSPDCGRVCHCGAVVFILREPVRE